MIKIESLMEFLLSESEFQSDVVTLPNALIARWTSYGYPFHQLFVLNTFDGINSLACWWLKNQNSMPHIKDQLLEYFIEKYHFYDGKNPTLLMQLVWKTRKDLQASFPYYMKEDNESYWAWWAKFGCTEYNVPIISNSNNYYDGETPTLLMQLVWKTRKDLQDIFPYYMGNDCDNYWAWWIESGHREYNVPIINNDSNNELKDFFLNKILRLRPDVTSHFSSLNDGDYDSNILRWIFEFGLFEYKRSQQTKTEPNNQSVKQNPTKHTKKNRIALIGHPTGTFGLGEDVRLIKEALELQGYLVDSYIANNKIGSSIEEGVIASQLSEYEDIYQFNVFCLPAFDMIAISLDYGVDLFVKTYNIGIWQWELSNFPKEADFAFKLVDRILTISNFSAKSLLESNEEKIVKVYPQPLKEYPFNEKTREYFGLPQHAFMFFFAFDKNSFIERKNPLAAIESFQRAFPLSDKSKILVLKVMGSQESQVWNECYRRSLCDKRIYIIDKVLTRSDLSALMNSSDCVVSLHRAEGFGRLMAEAFLMEKPVICSQYSGNLDYTLPENSFLVGGDEVPVFYSEYLFAQNQVWFQPDINQAADAFKKVVSDYKEAKLMALKGRNLIMDKYSIWETGRFLKSSIEDLLIKGEDE